MAKTAAAKRRSTQSPEAQVPKVSKHNRIHTEDSAEAAKRSAKDYGNLICNMEHLHSSIQDSAEGHTIHANPHTCWAQADHARKEDINGLQVRIISLPDSGPRLS